MSHLAAIRKMRPPHYVEAATAIAIGGLLNGFDTGSIGSMTTMPQFKATIGHLSATLLGFTVSLVMLTGTIPAFFAGHLAERFGRLRTILLGTVLLVIGAALQASASALPQFLVGRVICGLGQGVYLSNMYVYVCEVAPAQRRGVIGAMPQLATTAGICAGYFTCYGSVKIQGSMAWRAPLIVQCAAGTVLAVMCLALPESPRWLMQHGKPQLARRAIERLGLDIAEAERDYLTSTEQRMSLSLWQSLRLLFSRGYRARTTLALFMLGMVQLSGIDGVLYYAPTLFSQAGLSSSEASFFASGVSAILMLGITIPAFLFADRWGRRKSALTGGALLSTCMFLIGALYAAKAVQSSGAARWVVIVSVFIFSLTYCSTWGIVGKIYASEIQPGHTRAAANSVATGLGFFTNFLVAMLTPILLDKSAYGAYFLFGGLSLITVSVLALFMPETRGKSLESIQDAFNHPTATVSSLTRLAVRWRRVPTAQGGSPVPLEVRSSGLESTESMARPLRVEAL